jgi:GntR family transcriptional regulator, phosphonate transport system regulatory protein
VWRMIQSELEYEIRSGLLGPNDRLASESELAERFGVNRHTVRTALGNLAIIGLVRAHKGKGVFVRERPPEYRITRHSKWSEIEQMMQAAPSGRLVDTSLHHANLALAEMLQLSRGTELLLVETVRSASASLSIYGYHFFEALRFAGIERAFANAASYTVALREFGVDRFFRTSTWIDCRMPRQRETEVLGVPADMPTLVMMYVDCDESGRPILYGNAVIPNRSMVLRVDQGEPVNDPDSTNLSA